MPENWREVLLSTQCSWRSFIQESLYSESTNWNFSKVAVSVRLAQGRQWMHHTPFFLCISRFYISLVLNVDLRSFPKARKLGDAEVWKAAGYNLYMFIATLLFIWISHQCLKDEIFLINPDYGALLRFWNQNDHMSTTLLTCPCHFRGKQCPNWSQVTCLNPSGFIIPALDTNDGTVW